MSPRNQQILTLDQFYRYKKGQYCSRLRFSARGVPESLPEVFPKLSSFLVSQAPADAVLSSPLETKTSNEFEVVSTRKKYYFKTNNLH